MRWASDFLPRRRSNGKGRGNPAALSFIDFHGSVTMGSVTMGSVTIGSVTESVTMGSVTIGSVTESVTMGSVTMGSVTISTLCLTPTGKINKYRIVNRDKVVLYWVGILGFMFLEVPSDT
jgi:hypothetical protein